MKIERPDANHIVLTARRHYVLLAIGLAGLFWGFMLLFAHTQGAWGLLVAALLWLGFSSGHGTMTLDRTKRIVVTRKVFFFILRTQVIPFADIRCADAALLSRNRYFRLVLRGGREVSLESSANMINNAEEAADMVNELLGVYGPNMVTTQTVAPLNPGR